MGVLTNNQLTFASTLAALMNYSPRVVGAWCLAERSGSSAVQWQAQGRNNWLNVEAFDSGWSSFSTDKEVWATPTRAAQATWSWILHKSLATLKNMLLAARGKSDGEQLRAIWQSPWTGNFHYSNGTLLEGTYRLVAGVQFPTGLSLKTSGQSNERSITETRTLPYEFSRGTSDDPQEDSWTAIERLAQEVKWHAYMRNGAVWYASDDFLVKQPPKYVFGEFAQGIDDLSFNVDTRGQTDDGTIHCEAKRYAVSPGDCIELKHEGPADGMWIVYDVSRSAGSSTAELRIRRPVKALDEPAPQTQTKTITTSAKTGGTQEVSQAGTPQQYANLIAWSVKVSAAKRPYVWGGGHVSDLSSLSESSGFDCSGAVCFALFKAGFLPANGSTVSGGLMSWGLDGRGKFFTVWASSGHTFIEFHGGTVWRRFDTVPDYPSSGPRVWKDMGPEPIGGEGTWAQRHAHGF